MNPNKYPEVNYEAERAEMVYESQIQQLHRLAERLAAKVEHITADQPNNKTAGPIPMHLTRLNRSLQEVIHHFESIIDSIEN